MKKILTFLLFSIAAIAQQQKTAAQQTPADTADYFFFHKKKKKGPNVLITPQGDKDIFKKTKRIVKK